MRGVGMAALAVLCMGLISQFCPGAQAQTPASQPRLAQAVPPDAPPPRKRPPTRLRVQPYYDDDQNRVYPRYNPGPNAVRECNVAYVQEFRPSGTVIVPHMSCYWRRG